jgi:hypothetical protein
MADGWLNISFDSAKLDALREHLAEKQSQIIAALTVKTSAILFQLQGKIVAKLSGEVLKVKTGALRSSVTVQGPVVEGGIIRGSVGIPEGPTHGYAMIHTLGTGGRAYEVMSVKAKALAWATGEGKMAFARRVMHPTIPAKPFVHPALEESREEIIRELGQAVADVLKEK